MEVEFKCFGCGKDFDGVQAVPLVLKCGDSVCMNCLIRVCGQAESECPVCGFRFLISFSVMKDFPVNKALVRLVKQRPRISCFSQSNLDQVHPYVGLGDLGKERCKRLGCSNPKYEHLNVVYEYCSIACFELDLKV